MSKQCESFINLPYHPEKETDAKRNDEIITPDNPSTAKHDDSRHYSKRWTCRKLNDSRLSPPQTMYIYRPFDKTDQLHFATTNNQTRHVIASSSMFTKYAVCNIHQPAVNLRFVCLFFLTIKNSNMFFPAILGFGTSLHKRLNSTILSIHNFN